ncbi:hypothetical protein EAF00_002376 [Botryotinia globosa]|nr:hypothetical protein EAF00_002376 [Botryotinia globosa]
MSLNIALLRLLFIGSRPCPSQRWMDSDPSEICMKGSEIQGPFFIVVRGGNVHLKFPSNKLCSKATLIKIRIAATVFIAMQFSVRIRRVVPTCRVYTPDFITFRNFD